MKVKELKELIEGMDDDGEVYINMQYGCCSDTLEMKVIDSDQYSSKEAWILVAAVPGYKSCIQAGRTKEADKKYWEKLNPAKI